MLSSENPIRSCCSFQERLEIVSSSEEGRVEVICQVVIAQPAEENRSFTPGIPWCSVSRDRAPSGLDVRVKITNRACRFQQ